MTNLMHVSSLYGDPDDPQFQQNYMTTIYWNDFQSKGIIKLDCHKLAADYFRGFLEELSTVYKIIDLSCYNNRNIRGGSIKSQHAWGGAIDINPQQNPSVLAGQPVVSDLPIQTEDIAMRHNLFWGKNWTTLHDSMHFELVKYIP